MVDDPDSDPGPDPDPEPDSDSDPGPDSDSDPDSGLDPGSDEERPRTRAAVRATYDRIGPHFAKTRANPWPEVEAFLDGRAGEVGLDVGCGNGRHTDLLADCCDRTVGLDASRALLQVARERPGDGEERSGDRDRDPALVQGDAGRLPFVADSVDLGVYVATLHHLPTRAGRVASLDDLARV